VTDTPFSEVVLELIEKMREPLGLDRWEINSTLGPITDAVDMPEPPTTAACNAAPEYRQMRLVFDPDQFKTGNDLGETIAHELAHPHIWPIHAVAEELAEGWAASAPKNMQGALRAKFAEEVRKAAETTTTDIGHVFIKLLRRLWDAEAKVREVEAARRAQMPVLSSRLEDGTDD
jgi:hypothetical protein